jgi:hypothetical protein
MRCMHSLNKGTVQLKVLLAELTRPFISAEDTGLILIIK